jgi:hypothetical protein
MIVRSDQASAYWSLNICYNSKQEIEQTDACIQLFPSLSAPDITRKKNQVNDRPAQEGQIEDSRSIDQVAGQKFNNMKNLRLAASVFR